MRLPALAAAALTVSGVATGPATATAAVGQLSVVSPLQVVSGTSPTSMVADFTVRNGGATTVRVDYFMAAADLAGLSQDPFSRRRGGSRRCDRRR